MANRDNPASGKQFEEIARKHFFSNKAAVLRPNFKLEIGVGKIKKGHNFDLGSEEMKIIVECKRHTWTEGKNSPSAKISVWNEAMYYFSLVPHEYQKVLFVLRHLNEAESLADHYVRQYRHLIPEGTSILEYDEESQTERRAYPY
jgi:hypothetical protein